MKTTNKHLILTAQTLNSDGITYQATVSKTAVERAKAFRAFAEQNGVRIQVTIPEEELGELLDNGETVQLKVLPEFLSKDSTLFKDDLATLFIEISEKGEFFFVAIHENAEGGDGYALHRCGPIPFNL